MDKITTCIDCENTIAVGDKICHHCGSTEPIPLIEKFYLDNISVMIWKFIASFKKSR